MSDSTGKHSAPSDKGVSLNLPPPPKKNSEVLQQNELLTSVKFSSSIASVSLSSCGCGSLSNTKRTITFSFKMDNKAYNQTKTLSICLIFN